MITVIHVLWLLAVWLALWSDVSVANVLTGLVVAIVIVRLFPTRRSRHLVVRPWKALRFAVFFLYKLVESSVVVARTVVVPRGRMRSGIVAVPLSGCSDAVVTLIADAISLTPGTLTLEVKRDPLTLYVHVLHLHDVEDVRRDVRKLEVLAVEAFGDREALAGLVIDDTSAWRGTT